MVTMASTQLVRDFMGTDLVMVAPTDAVETVVKIFDEQQLRALPVVDGQGKLVGMVSETDLIVREAPVQTPLYLTLLGSVIYFESTEKFQQQLKKSLGMLVQDVMSTQPLTATPNMSIAEVAQIMLQHRVSQLPVLDEQNNLVGMISQHDLIHALRV
jgi:CBS domain-containing protein